MLKIKIKKEKEMKHNKMFLFIMEIFRKLIRVILFKKYQKLTKLYLKRGDRAKKQRQKIEIGL